MKLLKAGIWTIGAVLLAGCIVTAVYPYYSARVLCFEPGLVGNWKPSDNDSDHWQFAPAGTNAYRVTAISAGQTNVMEGHCFRLHGQLFLDLYNPQPQSEAFPPPIPSHLALRVLQVQPSLKLAPLSNDWLADWLKKNPKAIPHRFIQIGDKPQDVQVVLTAQTPELQRLLVRMLKTDAAWGEATELKPEGSSSSIEH
jgi:hypothetical protein